MKFIIVKGFSFSNILVFLLIANLSLDILCPIHIGLLYIFKIPLSNIIYWDNGNLFVKTIFIPTIISYCLTILAIPTNIVCIFIEKLFIRYGKIFPPKGIELSKKKNTIFHIILICAVLAYIISLCGWIHTMIPYSPEEFEQLRYD